MVVQFEIISYVSVGPLRWNMSPGDVAAILGSPSRHSRNTAGNHVELWEALAMSCHYTGDTHRLVEVTFSRPADLTFNGVELLQDKPRRVVAELIRRDPGARRGFGSLVFPALGVSLNGFAPFHEDDHAVGAFRRGQVDELLPLMKDKLPRA